MKSVVQDLSGKKPKTSVWSNWCCQTQKHDLYLIFLTPSLPYIQKNIVHLLWTSMVIKNMILEADRSMFEYWLNH